MKINNLARMLGMEGTLGKWESPLILTEARLGVVHIPKS